MKQGIVASLTTRTPIIAAIIRRKRGRCESCGQRRVLYTIGVAALEGSIPDETIPACAPCWGLR